MKRIAIYGGSFNPIHKGHINLALEINFEYNFDKILLIPTKISPHKDNFELVSCEHRLNMCKIATRPYGDLFEVSDVEIKQQGKSYSIFTVEKIKRMYPDASIYMIVGSDMFLTFDKWYRYEDILNQVILLTGSRNDTDKSILESKANELKQKVKNAMVYTLNIKIKEMSSTQIRNIIRNGNIADNYLDGEVFKYIKENNLYIG